WDTLPDRPDAMTDGALSGTADPLAGKPRRSILLGDIPAGGRNIPVRLERVAAPDGEPVWLVAAQTVDNIPLLYRAHGPGWIHRQVPDWARERTWGQVARWQWIALALLAVAAP